MYSIDKEKTALSKLGLSYDKIMNENERIEIDPVAKTSKKEKYIQFELVNSIINAYADDLTDAYQVVESLQREHAELSDEIERLKTSDQNKTTQLRQVLEGDSAFKEAETLLAQLDQQMEEFEKAKKEDREMIAKLQRALEDAREELLEAQEKAYLAADDQEELERLRNDIPQMRDEMQQILDDLMANLQEAGIEIETE